MEVFQDASDLLRISIGILQHYALMQCTVNTRTERRDSHELISSVFFGYRAGRMSLSLGNHLRQLLPFIEENGLFTPRHLETPSLDASYIAKAVSGTRASLGLVLLRL